MSTRKGRLLPREGFHADVLGTLIRNTLLNPILLAPAVLLARFTERGRLFASENASLSSWIQTFAALGLVRVVNSWLTRRTLNNGVKDAYNWTNEVVLITGGSDGIGARIAQMLAERDIKVVVLDVQPLAYEPRALCAIEMTSAWRTDEGNQRHPCDSTCAILRQALPSRMLRPKSALR